MAANNDSHLFHEVKKSSHLIAEFEMLTSQLALRASEFDNLLKELATETETLEQTQIATEVAKEEGMVLESQLEITLDSIRSLKSVLQEVHDTTGKLADSEKSHIDLLDKLEKENDYCRMKIPSLEERIRQVYEEAKLVQIEKQAAELELRRQREEGLDKLIGLQRECESIKSYIKSTDHEIYKYQVDEGVIRDSYPLKYVVEQQNSGSKSIAVGTSVSTDLNGIISELVESKMHGLEEMIRQHVERRFHNLETDLYAKTVPYPVYKGTKAASIGLVNGCENGTVDKKQRRISTLNNNNNDNDNGSSPASVTSEKSSIEKKLASRSSIIQHPERKSGSLQQQQQQHKSPQQPVQSRPSKVMMTGTSGSPLLSKRRTMSENVEPERTDRGNERMDVADRDGDSGSTSSSISISGGPDGQQPHNALVLSSNSRWAGQMAALISTHDDSSSVKATANDPNIAQDNSNPPNQQTARQRSVSDNSSLLPTRAGYIASPPNDQSSMTKTTTRSVDDNKITSPRISRMSRISKPLNQNKQHQ